MIEILQISLVAFMFSKLAHEERSILSWYNNLIEKLPWWLYMPLGGCYRCFVGQVCLWYSVLVIRHNLVISLFYISAGILSSMIYNKLYEYLDE